MAFQKKSILLKAHLISQFTIHKSQIAALIASLRTLRHHIIISGDKKVSKPGN